MHALSQPTLLFITISLASLISGCAHHRDVRPGADGIHRVVTQAAEQQEAERGALSQAEHFCEQTKKTVAIVSEQTQYRGSMDENTRKTLRNASTAASVLGHMQDHNSSSAKNFRGAGTVGHIMTGDDAYSTDMKFKCQ